MQGVIYRLDVLSKYGWDTIFLSSSFARLDKIGYDLLEPSGPFRAYRVRKARKGDLVLLNQQLYKFVEPDLWVWYGWEVSQ